MEDTKLIAEETQMVRSESTDVENNQPNEGKKKINPKVAKKAAILTGVGASSVGVGAAAATIVDSLMDSDEDKRVEDSDTQEEEIQDDVEKDIESNNNDTTETATTTETKVAETQTTTTSSEQNTVETDFDGTEHSADMASYTAEEQQGIEEENETVHSSEHIAPESATPTEQPEVDMSQVNYDDIEAYEEPTIEKPEIDMAQVDYDEIEAYEDSPQINPEVYMAESIDINDSVEEIQADDVADINIFNDFDYYDNEEVDVFSGIEDTTPELAEMDMDSNLFNDADINDTNSFA